MIAGDDWEGGGVLCMTDWQRWLVIAGDDCEGGGVCVTVT